MKTLAAHILVQLAFVPLAFAETAEVVTSAAGEHGHEAAASSGGLPQFDPTWFPSQIFWLAVAFFVLYLFFSKKTLPEISSVIENRRNHIRSDLDMAEKLTEDAEKVQAAYENGLQSARDTASQAVQDVETLMKTKGASEYEAFRKRSESEIVAAENRIAVAKSAAMDDMNTIAAEVAAVAVKKIIGTNTDVQKAKSIVESLTGKAKAA
jgi:F-type H+-transporting ATPase subunit b